MDFGTYIKSVNDRYGTQIAREHAYRGDLQRALETALPGIRVTNEPARVACGAPDYILTNRESNLDVGYIEAKDIGRSLDDKSYKEQFDRYRSSLANLLVTDYLEFRLYRNSELTSTISIGRLEGGQVKPIPENFAPFERLLQEFAAHQSQTVTTSSALATIMAGKARLLADVIERAVQTESGSYEDTTLQEQLAAFKDVLIHEIDAKQFADIYSQTIAYGMFAARLHDNTGVPFSRQQAAQLIPETNPFLRKLFQYISGYDIDSRISWIVDSLAEAFRATDVDAVMKDFGKATGKNDPVLHFYEHFLAEYDPNLRRSRGVWYTPEPVVQFIVRAIDDVLREVFKLTDGLADASKTRIKIDTQVLDGRSKTGYKQVEYDFHRVQILDPAAGTGTFLAEIIRVIYGRFANQQGAWNAYVRESLIPRLNGFELLMASYAMAHLKLDMLLKDTGYRSLPNPNRLRIYLTNSLEEHHPDTGTLFASWLSKEANEANFIKRDTPVMVVLGNPPYSRHSLNKSSWLSRLLDDYKKEPDSSARLQERNSKWLNDDYVKFIRYGQHLVEKNGFGVLGFVTNHGFLDNPTFRGMRRAMLDSFSRIYVVNLHGNANVDELPGGEKDENVFDIKQGVSIVILISAKKVGKCEVFYKSLVGTRESKYGFLSEARLGTTDFQKLKPEGRFYHFVPRNNDGLRNYNSWPALDEIFESYSTGYYTSCDDEVIGISEHALRRQIGDGFDSSLVRMTAYRPFDVRFVYYDVPRLTRARKKFVERVGANNLFILSGKSTKNYEITHFFVSRVFSELKCAESSKGSYMFPLRMDGDGMLGGLNIQQGVFERYKSLLKSDEDLLDYIYAILNSGVYRSKYYEALKDAFPRIPYPQNEGQFDRLVLLGRRLRTIHLLEFDDSSRSHPTYPVDGDNRIDKIPYFEGEELGRVWINDEQYFGGVARVVWEHTVGGYQPAEKWLKDRKGEVLPFADIRHYQRMLVALAETPAVVEDIDEALEGLIC